ncbi:unnamed protein product, partial [Mesorhabditis belari]|uniref:ACB domain-containing protein n=1 Tax=Mesorhabditis belari TaxID=2138241 RepID=A0AAF3EKY3_9BILA
MIDDASRDFLPKPSQDAVEGMLRLLKNPAKSITHVHIHGALEAGTSDLFASSIIKFAEYLAENKIEGIEMLYVNCVYVQGNVKTLFTVLKGQLNFYENEIDDFWDLIDALKKLRKRNELNANNRIYVVFYGAEALQMFSTTQLLGLFSIPTRVLGFVRFITVSELPWSEIGNTSEFVSAPINFKVFPPTLEDIISMIRQKLPEVSEQFIRFIASALYLHYADANLLYKKVYDAWQYYAKKCPGGKSFCLKIASEAYNVVQSAGTLQLLTKKRDTKSTLPLSVSSRYLVLAAFFASQNNAAADSRYFATFHGRERRNENRERQQALARIEKDIDVKQFDLTRLYMIYRSLLEKYPPKERSLLNSLDPLAQITKMGEEVSLSEVALIEKEWGMPLESLYKAAVKYYKEEENNGHLVVAYDDRLQFMAYSKQVKLGPYQDSHNDAGWFDFTGSDRIKAWQALGQLGREEAMAGFVFLLDRVCPPFKQFMLDSIEAPNNKAEEAELRVLNGQRESQRPGTHQEPQIDYQVYEAQRKQIQEALNTQTYHQFLAYAQQQIPSNPEQVLSLILRCTYALIDGGIVLIF